MVDNKKIFWKNGPQGSRVQLYFSPENIDDIDIHQWLYSTRTVHNSVSNSALIKEILCFIKDNALLKIKVEDHVHQHFKKRDELQELKSKKDRLTKKENVKPVTRTPDTRKKYLARAKLLYGNYKKSINGDINKLYNGEEECLLGQVTGFISYLIARQQTVSINTWKQYKYSVSYWLTGKLAPTLSPDAQQKVSAEVLRLKAVNNTECRSMTNNTSSAKAKKISQEEIQLLLNAVKNTKGRNNELLYHWIIIMIALGLRPIEVMSLELIEEGSKKLVKITNAKATNGRGTGKYRKINISKWPKDAVDSVEKLVFIINSLHGKGRSNDQIYNSMRQCMYRLSRTVLGFKNKYPTLTTLRHQFRSNQVAKGASSKVVAELMGHASQHTAENHYGRKAFGNKNMTSDLPIEIENEVEAEQNYIPEPR